MKKILFLTVALILATVMLLAGCNKEDVQTADETEAVQTADQTEVVQSTDEVEDSESGKDSEPMKVGFLPSTIAGAPFFQNMLKTLEKYASVYNAEIVEGEANGDAAQQMSIFENMVNQGLDVIILNPINAESMDNAIGEAISKGIHVEILGNETQNYSILYTGDQYQYGYECGAEAARWINEKLGGEAEVLILNNQADKALIKRENGIIAGLEENAPNAQIVGQALGFPRATAMSSTESLLSAHPDVKVICCIVDEAAMGALEAVKGANKDTDDFGIFSVDGTLTVMEQIKEGSAIRSTIDFMFKLPEDSFISMARKLVDGETIETIFMQESTTVNTSNIDESIATYHKIFD